MLLFSPILQVEKLRGREQRAEKAWLRTWILESENLSFRILSLFFWLAVWSQADCLPSLFLNVFICILETKQYDFKTVS